MAEMSNHIARNLKHYREAAGLSTVELAERMGCVEACITDFEAGKVEPRGNCAKSLAVALGITPDELTRAEPPPPKPMKVTDPGDGR